jgi:1-acylglycerone phosphate reductase
LRLELEPLGVKVLTVVTGSVDTQIMANIPVPKLAPSSHYKNIEDLIVKLARGDDGIPRMSAPAYAERTVNDILSGATGKTWRGKYATSTRLGALLFPTVIVVSFENLLLGLHRQANNTNRTTF